MAEKTENRKFIGKLEIRNFSDLLVGDKALWIVLVILGAISIVSVFSSSSMVMSDNFGSSIGVLVKQFAFLLVGFAATIITAILITCFTPNLLKNVALPFYIISLGLLVLTFVPGFRQEINGATRWINLFGISVQPSEIIKMTLIVYISLFVTKHEEVLDEDSAEGKLTFYKLIVLIALAIGLILISNFSTALFITIITFIMFLFAGIRLKRMLPLVGIMSGLGVIMFILIMTCPAPAVSMLPRLPTWQTRVISFMPSLGKYASGYNEQTDYVPADNHQVTQAKKAIAEGGFWGKGPGNSTQRYKLSQAYCDFIYAIIVEEYGWIGAIVVLLLYVIFFTRVLQYLKMVTFKFDTMVLAGMTFMMVAQAFIHICVVVNVLPATGQTLPFISSGGSSLIISCIEFGIIQGIVEYTKRRVASAKNKDDKDINSNNVKEL